MTRIGGLEGRAGRVPTFAITGSCRVRSLLPSGRNTCRLSLSVATRGTRVVKFDLFGSGNRGISVCFGLPREGLMVSHAGDNVMSFNGGDIARRVRIRSHQGAASVGCVSSFTLTA